MNKQTILLLTLALALSNANASVVLQIEEKQYEIASSANSIQQTNKFSKILINSGLEKEAIDKMEEKAPKNYFSEVSDTLHKIKALIPAVEEHKMEVYVANQNMKGNYPLFTSYSEKIRLLQNTYKIALSSNELSHLNSLSPTASS